MNHNVYVNYKKAYVTSKINEIVENFMKLYPECDNEELVRKIVNDLYRKSKSINSLLDGTMITKIAIAYHEIVQENEVVEDSKSI